MECGADTNRIIEEMLKAATFMGILNIAYDFFTVNSFYTLCINHRFFSYFFVHIFYSEIEKRQIILIEHLSSLSHSYFLSASLFSQLF